MDFDNLTIKMRKMNGDAVKLGLTVIKNRYIIVIWNGVPRSE